MALICSGHVESVKYAKKLSVFTNNGVDSREKLFAIFIEIL